MKVRNKTIGKGEGYFIIEEGNTCQGDLDRAISFIEEVKRVGADAVEFQFAIAEDFYIKSHFGFELFKKLEYKLDEIKKIIDTAHRLDIGVVAAPLSHNLVPKLADINIDAFNINASDINNPAIIDSVCKSKLPFFISLPLADEEEIAWISDRCKNNNSENYTFLLGQHTMASGDDGVQPEDSNLGYIRTLKYRSNKNVGYIDHSRHIFMPSVALAAGADCITKHMTFNREDKMSDWFVCLEPKEMISSISHFRAISKSLLTEDKVLAPGENMDKNVMRRSIVTTKSLSKGHIITEDDICYKRPGGGIEPNKFTKVLGKTILETIGKDELIDIKILRDGL